MSDQAGCSPGAINSHGPAVARQMAGMLGLLALTFAASASAGVADATGSGRDDWKEVMRLIGPEGKPLAALAMLERLVDKGEVHPVTSAQVRAMVGDEQGARRILDEATTVAGGVLGAGPDPGPGWHPHDALAAIVHASRGRQIVILNESHFTQRHRAFALQVARALREEGFTHFGAEAFTHDIRDLLAAGPPDHRAGFYVLDPFFADLVRQVAAIGYEVFPYEQREDQQPPGDADGELRIAVREQAQAANIKRVLAAAPHARLLILSGGGHMAEVPDARGRAWMGYRLNRLTGTDPLTVNQVAGTPPDRPDPPDAAHERAFPDPGQRQPQVLVHADGRIWSVPGHDMVVMHPRTRYLDERPEWAFMDGYRRPTTVRLPGQSGRRLVQAFPVGGLVTAIAIDQVVARPAARQVTLALPVGEYRVDVQDESGSVFRLGTVSVK